MRTTRLLLLLSIPVLLASSCAHLRMGLFVLKENPREDDPTSIPEGRLAFEANCAQCHGVNADGNGALASSVTVPPTNFTAPDYAKSATRISAHIAYGKGESMPAFVDKLPENTIWDIGNYLHSLQRPKTATP